MAIEIKIDGYDSFEQIAVGGMAAVYRARKISIDKVVAIKVLFPYLANDTSFIDRFQREAKSAAKVQHENIVNVVDFGGADGCYYIVMEFYEGVTLADLLKGDSPIPLDIAVAVLLDVCLGLEAAHAKGIVHRDIKPANIIYTNQGGIKIADFGLAKKSDTMTVVTQPGEVLGTPAYMSPEQAAGEAVGTQSDLFSLGVVAFEMLCRKRPFEGSSYSEVIEKIQTYDVPPLSHDNPLIRPDFETIVGRMLEKSTSSRYQDISDVISDLEQAMETFEIKRDRRRLKKYIKDPTGYAKAFNDKMITRCLSQGTYFMQKGNTHLTEAMQEFKRILYLDPSNERARKHLAKIMSERGQGDSTVAIEAARAGTATATQLNTQAEKGKRRRPQFRRRKSSMFWPWFNRVATPVLVTGLVLGGWWAWNPLGGADDGVPVLSSPSRLTVTEGETIEFSVTVMGTAGDSVRVYGENLPVGAGLSPSGHFEWTVGYDQAGEHTIDFFVDDGSQVGTTRTVVQVVDRRVELSFEQPAKETTVVGKPVDIKLQAASQIGNPVVFALDDGPSGMKLDKDRIRWTPSASQAGTHRVGVRGTDGVADATETVVIQVKPKSEPEPKVTPPPPDPMYGQLSVYFLGGVGELYLDGKRFKEQPPFTGVVVPTGQYTVSCRMFKSEDSREFHITVEEGKNTVVEYEVGGDPSISHESADG